MADRRVSFIATLISFFQNLLARFANSFEVLEKVQVCIDLLSIHANLTTLPTRAKNPDQVWPSKTQNRFILS